MLIKRGIFDQEITFLTCSNHSILKRSDGKHYVKSEILASILKGKASMPFWRKNMSNAAVETLGVLTSFFVLRIKDHCYRLNLCLSNRNETQRVPGRHLRLAETLIS